MKNIILVAAILFLQIASLVTSYAQCSTIYIGTPSNPYVACPGFRLTANAGSDFYWYLGDPDMGGSPLAPGTYYDPTVSGMYYLKGKNSCGTWQKASQEVVMLPKPLPPVLATTDVIVPYNKPFMISAEGAAYNQDFRWFDQNNNIIRQHPNIFVTHTNQNPPVIYQVALFENNCSSDRVIVSVRADPLPTASAGIDVVITLPTNSTTLTGSGSDLNASGATSAVTYNWVKISGPNLSVNSAGTASWNITGMSAGRYLFRLYVTDAFGQTVSDDKNVEVVDPAATLKFNSLQEELINVGNIKTDADATNLTLDKKDVVNHFNNELGKEMETVGVQFAPAKGDVIQPVVYDDLGRSVKHYLPVVPNVIGTGVFRKVLDQQGEYSGTDGISSFYSDKPYAVTKLENSPLGRIVEQGTEGQGWQPGGTSGTRRVTYGANAANDIRVWTISGTGLSALPMSTTTYGANQLKLETHTNYITAAKQIQQQVATDVLGLKVLERINSSDWSETYYIYDTKGNLRFIIPPALTKALKDANNFTPTEAQVNHYCYQYLYDALNRCISSKGPGRGWVHRVYDKRDRVVLVQDGRQSLRTWSFVKYDQFDRAVVTGLYRTNKTQVQLQTQVNGLSNGAGYQNALQRVPVAMGTDLVFTAPTTVAENQATNSITWKPGFSAAATSTTYVRCSVGAGTSAQDQVFPVGDIENMTFTYYDDYKQNDLVFQNSSLAFQSVTWTSNPDADTWQKFDRTFGKITGVSVRTLNSNQWHHTVKYYDKKQRPIQTVSTLPSGGTSRFSALYNFTGSVLQSRSEKHSQVAFRRYVYDHKGRVQKLYFKFNNQPEVILSSASYDPLGQTTDKKLFPDEGGTNFLQSIDYSYNIKGWLKKVNSATGSDAGETDYFGLEMAYESDDFLTSSTARKDGLITAVRWRNDLTSTQNLFSFDYDSWNRLQHANYKTGTAAAWNANDFYSEKDISYDRNGNLTGLKRYRKVDHMAVKELIDDLTYQYGSGGNQLMAVAEGSTSSTKDLGFKDGNVSTDDYAYDPNGNVLFDKNKNIVRINYNYLDLPEFLKFSDSTSTEISYDATGKRVSRIERDTQNNIVLRTDYAGDLLLIDGLPAVLFHEEGRLIPPAYDNKIDNKEANGTEGYPAKNTVTISSQVISNQTYVKAVSGTGTAKSGIWPIKGTQGSSGTIPVKPGETYSFKVLGYQTVGATASLYVSSNTGDVVWPGAVLPQGSVNETWVTSTFTVPAGVTEINVGVLWQTPSNGHTFFVNRVALYNTDWELQYFLTDQVGSPRVVLSTQPGVTSLTATFETENQTTEANQFLNIKTTNITSIPVIANATPGGNESIYLDQNYNIGPARSIKVFPGDKVDASAHSYYSSASGLSKTLGSVMAAKLIQVMTSTAPVPIDQGVNNAYAFSDNQDPGFALSRNQGLTSPSAFLNYILFDINYTPLEAKSFPISPTAGSRLPVTMDQVSVKQPGYMFVYLSFDNNSPYQVHFDDFKIRHTESPVIQITDYYPYGMTAMNWVREGETENWFTFQQKEYDKKSGLNDFHARQYDATLGRWFVQDPANQFPSPYLAMGNNPVNGIDPNGEVYVVDDIIVAAVGFVFGYLAYGAINDDWDSDAVKAGLITAVMFEASYLLQGAGGAATSSMTAEMAADFAVQKGFTMLFSTAIPAIPIYESEDLNLSVRPTLSTSGVSASVSASYHKGKTDWTLSVNGGIAEGGFSTSMDLGVMYSTNNWSFGGNIGATNPAGEAKWNERVNFAAGYSRDGIGVMANLGWQGEFGKKFDQVSGWTLAYNRDGYQLSYNETYNTGYGKRTDGKGTDLPTWSRKLTFASARDNIGFTYGDTRNANGHVITGEIARGDYKMSFGKGSAASAITPTKFYYQQFDFEWNSIKALLGKIFK